MQHQPPSFILRSATQADIDALTALENQCFTTDKLSRRSFRHFVTTAHAQLLIATHQQQLAGYILLLYRKNTVSARIYSLAVAAEFRKTGLGQQLITAAEQWALEYGRNTLQLEVRPDNIGAIRLYEKLGYQAFSTITDFYEDHSDAIRMKKTLSSVSKSDIATIKCQHI